VLYGDLHFHLKSTNFGHMGLFAEQRENWDRMRAAIRARMRRTHDRHLFVLNLFGYTGAARWHAARPATLYPPGCRPWGGGRLGPQKCRSERAA
jgi:23S rRNA G2069 N7-methylase RlmK/C1962 C5-methylase RlmI